VISEAFAGTTEQIGLRSRTSFDESPETLKIAQTSVAVSSGSIGGPVSFAVICR
jgi:hypothetical protein